MSQAIHVTDKEFEARVLQSDKPVLVDVYADWCMPCRMIAPAIEQLAKEFEGRVTVAKVNVDEAPGVADEYGIRGVPTLMMFRQGRLVDVTVGALPPATLRQKLEALAAVEARNGHA